MDPNKLIFNYRRDLNLKRIEDPKKNDGYYNFIIESINDMVNNEIDMKSFLTILVYNYMSSINHDYSFDEDLNRRYSKLMNVSLNYLVKFNNSTNVISELNKKIQYNMGERKEIERMVLSMSP